MKTISERIRYLRKTILSKTQKEFGSALGLKPNSVSDIESGKNKPTEQTIKAICREFSVSENWLRTGEGDPFCPMDRQMEIAQLTNQLLTEADDSFKNIIISALSNTSEEDWKAFERFIDKIIEEKKKAEQ